MPHEEETEEVEVTQLVERIEQLEKESISQKEKIAGYEQRIAECENSIDKLAEIVGKLNGG